MITAVSGEEVLSAASLIAVAAAFRRGRLRPPPRIGGTLR